MKNEKTEWYLNSMAIIRRILNFIFLNSFQVFTVAVTLA